MICRVTYLRLTGPRNRTGSHGRHHRCKKESVGPSGVNRLRLRTNRSSGNGRAINRYTEAGNKRKGP